MISLNAANEINLNRVSPFAITDALLSAFVLNLASKLLFAAFYHCDMRTRYYQTILVFFVVVSFEGLFGQPIIGATAGMANYQGDLIKQDFDIAQSRLGLGAFAEWHIIPEIAFQFSFSSFKVIGDDRKYSLQNNPGRFNRAIRMDNRLINLGGLIVYYPFYRQSPTFSVVGGTNFQPYVGMGMSYVINFHDISDQNSNDGLQQYDADQAFFSLPITIGYQVFFNRKFGVGLGIKSWIIFDDQSLDGYAWPGSRSDLMHFLTANIIYVLGKPKAKW